MWSCHDFSEKNNNLRPAQDRIQPIMAHLNAMHKWNLLPWSSGWSFWCWLLPMAPRPKSRCWVSTVQEGMTMQTMVSCTSRWTTCLHLLQFLRKYGNHLQEPCSGGPAWWCEGNAESPRTWSLKVQSFHSGLESWQWTPRSGPFWKS